MADSVTSPSALDLSTLVERHHVRIDGERYELRHPDEFSLIEQLRLFRQAKRVVELVTILTSDTATPSEAEEKEYETLLDLTCRAVLDAPDEVHARLREEHRSAISRAFTQLQSETNSRKRAGANPVTTAAPETNGSSSSLDSVDSTAATPSAG
ncbi:MAG TPA: hypothetical protein VK504_32600 [Vicinamibacterales bacterium]|nr:hypothetical protein [Vicinamibacterales bacterium]